MIESNLTAWWITAIISGVILFFMMIKFIITIKQDSKKRKDSKDSIESNLNDIYKEILCKDCYERLQGLLIKSYIESNKEAK